MFKKFIFIVAFILISPFNISAATYTYDLGINQSDISFSKEEEIEEINENLNDTATVVSDILEENSIIDMNLSPQNESGPLANITFSQIGWKTYIFKPEIRGLVDQNLAYHWEFGDGVVSNEKVARHAYEKPGDYQVTLKIYGKNNIELSNSKKITISFFNFANPAIWSVLGFLMVLLLVLFLFLMKRGKKNRYV